MEVTFENGRLAARCNSEKAMVRACGPEQAKRLAHRLSQLAAAQCLEDLREAPGRCHELAGNRAGQLSLDLDGPNRLIFRPLDPSGATRDGGGLSWPDVTEVVVIEIADTHS